MGHLLVVAKQRLLSQEIRNTFWFGGNDAIMDNAQDIVDAMRAAWATNLGAQLITDWTLYGFDVYDKTIPGVPGIEFIPTSGSLTGSNNTDSVATQIAMLVTFKAQVAPPNTNRKYLAGWGEGAMVDSLWQTAKTDLAAAWAADVLDIGTTTSLAIVMEVVALNLDGTVSGGNPLEYALVRQVPATQRRRRIGIGI